MGLRVKIFAVAVVLSLLACSPFMARAAGLGDVTQERTLEFHNTHTHENLVLTYWRDGRYDQIALEDINRFLRDHRNGHVHEMSYDLLNLLTEIKDELHRRHPDADIVFHVISGYRSPETNAMLRAGGGGQAKKSRHMFGDAIDIRVPGIETSEIRDVAWCLQRGGVGYYRGSDFTHVDTWKVRSWNWKPKAGMCDRGNS